MATEDRQADLILRGGRVIDGIGAPARPADVAVRGDRIAAVGELADWTAPASRDVTGLVVAPGFIDMHSHSDLALLLNGHAESKLRQGVTTEVIGQCGFSPAPAPEARRDHIRNMFGFFGEQVEWRWGSFASYLTALRECGISVNVAPLVGQGTIRAVVMGEDNRAPTGAELAAMQEEVRRAMEEGAFGLSSGLIYVPSMYAEVAELSSLAAAMKGHHGIYVSHIRDEREHLLEAVAEAMEIGRRAGVAVQISHLKSADRPNWGKVEAALEAMAEAKEREGLDISYDLYPYTAWNTGLVQLLPAWAREGGWEAIAARLRDPGARGRLRQELAEGARSDPEWWSLRMLASVGSEANRDLQGLTLAEIAARRGRSPEEPAMDLLLEENGQADMVGFAMSEEDITAALRHPLGMIGSDAAVRAPYGELGRGHPHPRSYGTFPRVLGRYAREQGALSLEEAVAKMTGRPAEKLGLKDRGKVSAGMAADLAVFDPATVADRATYQEPHQYPEGIHLVIVNGVVELDGGEHQGRKPGRVLAKQL